MTILGTSGDDTLNGTPFDDIFRGLGGNNILNGNGGVDSADYVSAPGPINVDLAAGTATANGYGGTDTLNGISAVWGGVAVDTITGDSNDNTIAGGYGADIVAGGAGNDRYYLATGGIDQITELANEGIDAIETDAPNGQSLAIGYTLPDHVENLYFQNAFVNVTGNAENNYIAAGAVYSTDNTIDGGLGADTMIGGYGNDTYIVDDMLDQVIESNVASSGTADHVVASVSYGLAANVENLTLAAGAVTGVGNGLNNEITGNAADNGIDGGAGADRMAGGAANDHYFVDDVFDMVVENAGEGASDFITSSVAYTLPAEVEHMALSGTATNAVGNALANVMTGNAGQNGLDGGAGADTLTGGGGNDLFFLTQGQSDGDRLVDFVSGADVLIFSGYGPGATFTQNDATHWQVTYNGGASFEVVTFLNGAAIAPSDFFFV